VPSSVNQGAINSAQALGQVSDECTPVNGTTYPIDFTDAIRMTYSTVEERDRLLQAVVSAWNSIIQPFDPIGITIYYVNASMSSTDPCRLDVIYRITGLTKQRFDWIVQRQKFLDLFKTNPPLNMWAIVDLPTGPQGPSKTEVSPVTSAVGPAVTTSVQVPVAQPSYQAGAPSCCCKSQDAQVQAPGCSALAATSRVFRDDDSGIDTLTFKLRVSQASIDELRQKGFQRMSDLSIIRQIDLGNVISLARDRYMLREYMFCQTAEVGGSAVATSNTNTHFFCQYWNDLTTRCWNDYRAKAAPDTKYDKAVGVVGTGDRLDGKWSKGDGIFLIDAKDMAADWETPKQYGSCLFGANTADCAYMPPAGCEPGSICPGQTTFRLVSYTGQPPGKITGSRGDISIAV